MEQLLFQSEGNPVKRKKAMRFCAGVLIVCGAVLILLFLAAGGYINFLLWMGVLVIALGVVLYFVNTSNSGSKAKLYIYEQHVEGVQVSPYKKFNLPFRSIDDVQKLKLFSNEMILLQSKQETYTVLTNDVDTAYRIICDKVYGGK